ncbi:MAG: DUF4332 domain-containing protein [Verrucomicrobiota bacterium]
MSALTAIPGLNPEAIELLEDAGIRSAGALAKLSALEAHQRVEVSAWQKGKGHRTPGLPTVQQWIQQAQDMPSALEDLPAALPAPAWDQEDDIPEAIVLERATLPVKNVYVPPSQRARRETAGIVPPAALPLPVAELPSAVPLGGVARQPLSAASLPPMAEATPSALPGFTTFENYQAGETRVAPLSRISIDAAVDPADVAKSMERIGAADSLSRWVQRGVVHPMPGLLIFGAIISLLWRLAMLGGIIALPWFILTSDRATDYRHIAGISAIVLAVLGLAQLLVLTRARCRVCSCHLFYSRDCVKNRKAHHIFGVGYVGSLALHLLIFQWFRCMYCGTAIRMWMGKRDN